MATLEELVVTLVAETSGLRAELNAAAKATSNATEKMDSAIQAFSDNSSKNIGFFETSMATMAGFLASEAVLGAFGLVKDAAQFLGDQLLKGGESAIAQEKALTRLANSLALTGQYSTAAQADLQKFADTMEAETGIADDVVASNLAVLSSITRLSSEGLKQAQKAAIDFSAAMGIDLESATRLVAKGVEGNVEAFKRYGITVTEGASKSENLTNILKALASTQGAAAGATQTFDGLLKQVHNSFGNYFEELSNAVVQNEAFKSVLSEVAKIFTANTEEAKANSQALKEMAGESLVAVINGMATFATIMDAVVKVGKVVYDILRADMDAIFALGLAAKQISEGDFSGAFDTMKSVVTDTVKTIQTDLNADTLFGNMAVTLMQVGSAAEQGLAKVKEGADGIVEPTVKATAAVRELTAAEKERQDNLRNFAKGLADQTTALDSEYKFQQELTKQNLDLELTNIGDNNQMKYDAQAQFFSDSQQQLLDQQATEDANLLASRSVQGANQETYNNARTALDKKQALDSQALTNARRKFEQEADKQKIADLQSTFSTISTLASSNNKTLAAIGKAAAITNATIDGYAAIQSSYRVGASVGGPYVGAAFAALAAAATAVNISKIAGVGLKDGMTSVPGNGTADNFPAVLAPNERVVDAGTNQDLKQFLANANGGQGGGNVTIEISLRDELVEFIEAKILERQRIGTSLLQPSVV